MFGAGRRIKLFAPKANSLTASVAVPAQCRAFALESEVVYGKIHRKEHRHPTLPLSVMRHFAYFALEENHAGPLAYAEPAASADRAKLWHYLTLFRVHLNSQLKPTIRTFKIDSFYCIFCDNQHRTTFCTHDW